MPTKGKCWSCGEIEFLFGTLLKKNGENEMYFAMCCGKCKRFYEAKAKEGGNACPGQSAGALQRRGIIADNIIK